MKKYLLILFSTIAIANGINAMESPATATQITSAKAAIRLQNPGLSESEISKKLLLQLVETGSEKELPVIIWLLKKETISIETLMEAIKMSAKSSPAIQVALYIVYLDQLFPQFSDEALAETLLRELTANERKEALEWALKGEFKDVTGAALETAISFNFYQGAELLLQYGTTITDRAIKAANDRAKNRDYRYLNLLQKPQLQQEKISLERERLPKQTELEKILRQLPVLQRK
jgi:hypothetical protein